jgi:hypothetical protein
MSSGRRADVALAPAERRVDGVGDRLSDAVRIAAGRFGASVCERRSRRRRASVIAGLSMSCTHGGQRHICGSRLIRAATRRTGIGGEHGTSALSTVT